MAHPNEIPSDNDGWFRRHIIDQLKDLKDGHREMIQNQREMHGDNVRRMDDIGKKLQDHEDLNRKEFEEIRADVRDLQPVKKLTYSMVALILLAFFGALIGGVMVSKMNQPRTPSYEGGQ